MFLIQSIPDSIHVVLDNGGNLSRIIEISFPIAVVAISLATLIISIRNNQRTLSIISSNHRENYNKDIEFSKRSNRPKLSTEFSATVDNETEEFVTQFKIFNDGLGPATDISIEYNFNSKQNINLRRLLKESNVDFDWETISENKSFFADVSHGSLSAGSEISVFKIAVEIVHHKELRNFCDSILALVGFSIKYKSIFDEEFSTYGKVNFCD